MAAIEIPKGIKAREFFTSFLPQAFAANVKDLDLSAYREIDFRMEFDITGVNRENYGVILRGGDTIEVSEGALEGAMMVFEMPADVFERGLAGEIPEFPLEQFLANPRDLITSLPPEEAKNRIQTIKSISGMMEVEALKGNEKIEMKVKFNGQNDPACKFIGDIKVLTDMMMGETNPVQGFMSGQYKITGSLPFAMSLQRVFPS